MIFSIIFGNNYDNFLEYTVILLTQYYISSISSIHFINSLLLTFLRETEPTLQCLTYIHTFISYIIPFMVIKFILLFKRIFWSKLCGDFHIPTVPDIQWQRLNLVMFLNSIQQQQNGTKSAVQQEGARNSFAPQRNQEQGKFLFTGLNIVLVPKSISKVIQPRMFSATCWFTLFSLKIILPKKHT